MKGIQRIEKYDKVTIMSKVSSSLTSNIKRRQKLKNEISSWIWLIPVVIVLYLMIWRPTVMGFYLSFFKMKGFTAEEFIGFRNYIEVIKDTQFLPTLVNTVEYVVWSLIIGFIPPLVLAICINEMMRFKGTLRIILYLPAIVPGVAVSLIWYYMYYPDATGFLNLILTKLGAEPYAWLNDARYTILYIIISMTWSGLPGTMLFYYASLQSVNVELYEAATIDGAGMFHRLFHVTLPQISGVLILQFVSQMIAVFQVTEQPMTMTGGGPNNASISLGYQLYKYGFVNGRVGHAMALGVITFLILVVCTIFYFKLEKKVSENF